MFGNEHLNTQSIMLRIVTFKIGQDQGMIYFTFGDPSIDSAVLFIYQF
jgi:hypothetical protein